MQLPSPCPITFLYHSLYVFTVPYVPMNARTNFKQAKGMDSNHFLRDFSDNIGLFHLINFLGGNDNAWL